jgi:TetR/AcrR family transcriptional repressor of nem operon
MARSKHNEQEVLEKAMSLFYVMGMKTPRSYVEKEMGINQFSIYASFVKARIVLESLKNAIKKQS